MNEYRDFRNAVVKEAPGTGYSLFRIGVILILLFVSLGIVGNCVGWFGEASSLVSEQLSPKELLRKYETFKNMHAQLAAKRASIDLCEFEITPEALASMPKDMRQDYYLRRQELAGMKSSFNESAAAYNAAMAKINWSFCNIGDLPEGATEPLPREYVQYINK